MRCDEVKGMLPDRLDDLLEAGHASTLDAHVASCEECQSALRQAAAVREALYRPWSIDSPSATARPPRSVRRATFALLRYAAVFAAGVFAARMLATASESATSPNLTAIPDALPAVASPLTDVPRRIR